jgi:hypothetical protein
VSRFGFTSLSQKGALPPENVGKEGIAAIGSELCQGVVVQTESSSVLFVLFRHPRPIY